MRSQNLKVIKIGVALPGFPIFGAGILYAGAYGSPSVIVCDGDACRAVFDENTCGATSVMTHGQDLLVSYYERSKIVGVLTDGDVRNRVARDSAGDVTRGPNGTIADGRSGVYWRISISSNTSVVPGKVDRIGPDGTVWISKYSRPRVPVVSSDGSGSIKADELPGKACPNLAFNPDGRSAHLDGGVRRENPTFQWHRLSAADQRMNGQTPLVLDSGEARSKIRRQCRMGREVVS